MKKIVAITILLLLSTSIVRAFSPQYGISSGLVGYWSLDTRTNKWTTSTTGSTFELSGVSAVNGTFTNMSQTATPALGKINAGLNFDGSNDTVSIAHNSNLKPTAAITISFWFKPRDLNKTTIQTMLSNTQNGGYSVSLNGTSAAGSCNASSLCYFLNSGGTYYITNYAKSNLQNNVWYHFAGSYDGSATKMFINGAQVDSVSRVGTISYTLNTPLCFASEPSATVCADSGGPNYYKGFMDEVRIYNRALSAQEINQLYRLGLSGYGR